LLKGRSFEYLDTVNKLLEQNQAGVLAVHIADAEYIPGKGFEVIVTINGNIKFNGMAPAKTEAKRRACTKALLALGAKINGL